MEMKVKRLNKNNPVPKYETEKAVGVDTFVSERVTIDSMKLGWVKLGLAVEAPEGTMVGLLVRSSTPKKVNLMLANALGVIDQDFSGNGDEIQACVLNFGEEPVTLEEGDRRFQLVVFRVERPELVEVEDMENPDRGGFGTTGD